MRRRRGLAALVAALALAALAHTAAVAAQNEAAPATDTGAVADGRDAAASAAAVRTLLDSARLWRQRGRDDLARAALAKLLGIEPGHREALRMLTAIEIEAERFGEAERLIARIERAAPGSPQGTELRELLAAARAQGVPVVRDRLRAIGSGGGPESRLAAAPRPDRSPAVATPARPRATC